MDQPVVAFMLGCIVLLLVLLGLRQVFARLGAGRLAQLEFRRRHGERVAELLDGAPDPRRNSPWIAIRLGRRAARMVAAPIGRGQLQAGIELPEHDLCMDVFHTNGERDELAVPDGVDVDAVRRVVAALAALGVDNVARPMPGGTHVLRLRFPSVGALPGLLDDVAPLLEELERLGADQPPNDWAQ